MTGFTIKNDGRTEANKTISVLEYDGHEQTILPPKPIENQKQGETKYFLFDKEKKAWSLTQRWKKKHYLHESNTSEPKAPVKEGSFQ